MLLSPVEIARAGRFHFDADRERWTRAHSALRTILAGYTGVAPLELAFLPGEHGKPALDPGNCGGRNVHFNLSHAGEWAFVAVSREVPVGIDVERIRDRVDIAALLRRLGEGDFPADRESCFQRWARREAKSKAAGGPLMAPVSEEALWSDLEAAPGYAAAVALLGHPPRPEYRSEKTPE